jgi:hypothetical protein
VVPSASLARRADAVESVDPSRRRNTARGVEGAVMGARIADSGH